MLVTITHPTVLYFECCILQSSLELFGELMEKKRNQFTLRHSVRKKDIFQLTAKMRARWAACCLRLSVLDLLLLPLDSFDGGEWLLPTDVDNICESMESVEGMTTDVEAILVDWSRLAILFCINNLGSLNLFVLFCPRKWVNVCAQWCCSCCLLLFSFFCKICTDFPAYQATSLKM